MNKSPKSKKTFDITPSEIYKKLRSQNYEEKLFNEALISVKETAPYNDMKDVALQHMHSRFNMQYVDVKSMQEKKNQVNKISKLAGLIDSSLNEIVAKKMKEAKPFIKKAVYQVLAEKAKEEELSVSSVHTSDLSSFEDESSSSDSSKDEKQNKNKSTKDLSTKEPKKGSSPLKPYLSPKKKISPKRAHELLTKELSKESVGAVTKRQRKPNPKYSGDASHEVP